MKSIFGNSNYKQKNIVNTLTKYNSIRQSDITPIKPLFYTQNLFRCFIDDKQLSFSKLEKISKVDSF